MPAGQAAKIQLVLRHIEIEGSTVYRTSELETLWADLTGKQISLADLYAARDRIRQKYSDDGWLLAIPVIVPQQASQNAAVIRIRIIEAYIDQIIWPEALAKYKDHFTECGDKITAERPARLATVERCLLLARDLPGLKIGSTLKRSNDGAGATALVIDVQEKPFDLSARTDNRTQPGRGPNEYFLSATENNLLRQHEAFTVSYGSAYDTEKLLFLEGAYKQVLTADGLTFTALADYSTGRPGIATLQNLGFVATSFTSEAGLTYPVIRAREQNLWLSGVFFTEDTQSDVTGGTLSEDRLRGFRFRINADEADTALGTAGVTQVLGTFSQGIGGLGSTGNGNPNASRPNGRVDFTKIEGTISRTQALVGPWSLFGAATGQWTADPLLIAEECSYGGRFFGRAFDPFELVGDRCWSLLGELRYDLPILTKEINQAQLYALADHGEVFRIDPAAGVPEKLSGSSVGGGLRLGLIQKVDVNLEADRATEGRTGNDWRFFFNISAKY